MPLRVALVAGPDLGHLLPVLGVGRALRERGHDVTVATGTQRRAIVEDEGHRFIELPLLAPSDRDDDFAHVIWRRAGEMAGPLASLLAVQQPDVVVADALTTAGGFAAELIDVAWLQLVPHHLMDPDPLVPPIGLGRPPARTPWRRRADAHIRRAQARDVSAGHRVRAEARAVAGLPPGGAGPVRRLVQVVPGLEPRRRTWPGDAHPLGPLSIDLPGPALRPPAGSGPVVLVADTTASSLPRPLAAAALDGLADGWRASRRRPPARLVVTTTAHPPSTSPTVTLGTGPHQPVLDLADVAVVSGGGGVVSKALARGVPLVVVPIAGDQRETAARVAHAGAGIVVPASRVSPRRLAAAMGRVLSDPSFRDGAERLAGTCRGLGPTRAATLVEGVADGRIGHVPTPAGPHEP